MIRSFTVNSKVGVGNMYVLEMKNITKEFPGVKALNNVSFQITDKEIHALCGENGAGKSTLMKVLSGLYPNGTYDGNIIVRGEEMSFKNITDAEKSGIAIIHQELELVKDMTIGENIFLGREPRRMGVIDWNKLYFETTKWLNTLGLKVAPDAMIGSLGIGQQQLVEIAKALSKDAKILILDEPTAALTESEVDILMDILRQMQNHGVACIYISHKLPEVLEISDRITVLRDGETIGTVETAGTDENKIVSMMVGRELTERYPYVEHHATEPILEVKNYSVKDEVKSSKDIIKNVNFTLKKGEILGIAGLMGSGRTELVMSLFGAFGGKTEGEILLNGKPIRNKTVSQAIKNGFALVTEDRKRLGLVLPQDVKTNATLSNLNMVSQLGIINDNEEIKQSQHFVKELRTKTASLETAVGTLSGGNQQKVVLARWLMSDPEILILDEPTRGIDVGAKYEIYSLMNKLVEKGVSIIMISSELPEVLGMSDRILVMREGTLVKEVLHDNATQENIMQAATGGK